MCDPTPPPPPLRNTASLTAKLKNNTHSYAHVVTNQLCTCMLYLCGSQNMIRICMYNYSYVNNNLYSKIMTALLLELLVETSEKELRGQ